MKGKKTGGRKPGSQNKVTTAVKEMVVAALGNVGGTEYLERQAEENPVAFMSLVGRVIPHEVAGALDHNVKVTGALGWKPPT